MLGQLAGPVEELNDHGSDPVLRNHRRQLGELPDATLGE